MNDRSASSTRSAAFRVEHFPFGVIPGQSRLFTDFQYRPQKVRAFYPAIDHSLKEFSRIALEGFATDRKKLAEELERQNKKYGAGPKTLANISRLEENDAVAVITGQQAGLFTGPAYTVYKAVSAIVTAGRLRSQDVNAVPVFWLASEDHDFDEIRRTFIPGEDGTLVTVETRPESATGETPVGDIALENDVSGAIRKFIRHLPDGAHNEAIGRLLEECYQPGVSIADAFAGVLSRLFSEYGLIIVSPLSKELRRLSLPLVRRAVSEAAGAFERLGARNGELAGRRYHTQVHVSDDSFPFFFIDDDGKRVALRSDEERKQFSAKDGSITFTASELLDRLGSDPSCLSPNALMRPLIQDYLFPTICYFGGSAEIAYFAQNSALYEFFSRPVTPIRHRLSLSLVDPPNRRAMNAYGIGFEDLFKGRESVSARIIGEILAPETADLFSETRKHFEKQLDALAEKLSDDAPLADSLSKRRRKMLWQLTSLRRKFLRSQESKDEVFRRRIDHLFGNLLPGGALQERSLNFFSFISRFGFGLIDLIAEASDPDSKDHTVITF